MTDKEIIKALEEMVDYPHYYEEGQILENALDLITRQQAELENLKVENQSLRSATNSLKMHYEEAQAENERLRQNLNIELEKSATEYDDKIKAEAYKEFAERVKEFMHNKFKALDEYEFEYI